MTETESTRKELGGTKNTVISFFSSIRLTVVLLTIIGFASIPGTLIPQRQEGAVLSHYLDPWVVSFLETVQLTDVYHSIWFVLLVGMLCVNIVICSAERLRVFMRKRKKQHIPSLPRFSDEEARVVMEGSLDDTAAQAKAILGTICREVRESATSEGKVVYGERGIQRRLFVYLLHLGVLVMIAGAAMGSMYGFEGYVEILEGESVDRIHLSRGEGARNLDFTVRCDDFSMEYYESGPIKEYRSDLSFVKGAEIALQAPVRVNHPVSFDGIRFYQSSYGVVSEAVIALSKGGEETLCSVRRGSVISPDGGKTTFHVLGVRNNFMHRGPAVDIGVSSAQGSLRFFVFKNIDALKEEIPDLFSRYPQFNPAGFEPYVFTVKEVSMKHYTGLTVNRDPGAVVVALGSIMVIMGILFTYFSSRTRTWITLRKREGRLAVAVMVVGDRRKACIDRTVRQWLGRGMVNT